MLVVNEMSLSDAEALSVSAIRARFSGASVAKLEMSARRLFRWLTRQGVASVGDASRDVIEAWCHAAGSRHGTLFSPSVSTIRNRRWCVETVGLILAQAGIDIGGWPIPTGRLSVPSRDPQPRTRPLSDVELEQLHGFADPGLPGSRRGVIVALAEAGGSASEIADVRAADVDLGKRTVRFRGAAERVNGLSGWGAARIEALNARRGVSVPVGFLACDGEPSAHKVSVRLYQALRDAGLGGVGGVTGSSVRLTGARRILESDGLEAAARFLGAKSLDLVAKALNHDWRNHP